ncbi:MAG: aminotransferase class III-fold pyridoxal phosphate-dependent enzyme [Hyphomicrobiaceae bacterium]
MTDTAPNGTKPLTALRCTPPNVSEAEAARIAARLFGATGPAKLLFGERERNFRVAGPSGETLIVKVSSPDESPANLDLQIQALRHIGRADPGLPIPQPVATLAGADTTTVTLDGTNLLVRALTWLEGDVVEESKPSVLFLRSLGGAIGRLDKALQSFFHPAAAQEIAWDLKRAAVLRPFAALIADETSRRHTEMMHERLANDTMPALLGLRHQIIHNDLHVGNLLSAPGNPDLLGGILDFGDMLHSARIIDLGFAAAEVTIPDHDPIETAAELAASFHKENALDPEEIAVLFDIIAARHAQTLSILAWRRQNDPTAAGYLEPFEKNSATGLAALLSIGREAATRRFAEATGSGRRITVPMPAVLAEDEAARHKLLTRRKARLGSGLELSYEEPVHIVRAEGVWMHGADGRRYLDAYNNVPQVGHCHPHVVAAIARQAATLNTNTRYLHGLVLDYADRLVSLMPEGSGLDACVFVNCGSEANDVAWRMATVWTGARGGIVMENAYHGGTEAVAHLSPYDVTGAQLAPHIRTLEAPDLYRGRYGADDAAAANYAADADRCIAELERTGHRTACWMVDTGFMSNGLILPPDGYVRMVAEKVRAAGGLLIADEVQFGYARSGSHFWGFDVHGVTPDMVTMGKPVGNGHPLGVIVTRREILERFQKQTNYFSTFGGNPVSAAAGMAVLDVIERERLQENARTTGALLADRIRGLMLKHAMIGDVRGYGLRVGVEIVKDRKTKAPDRAGARRIVNGMRRRGVLTSTDGTDYQVLKIRPPLPFRPDHVDILVNTMDETMTEAARG